MRPKRVLAEGRSSRWAFMDRFEVPQYDEDGIYLVRWRIVRTPWFGLYVHRMEGPDPRATLHDHPWSFLSIVLRGGYVEDRLEPFTRQVVERRIRWWNRVRTHDAHSIRRLLQVPTWTLLFVGPDRREWGYWEQIQQVASNEYPSVAIDFWRWTPYNEHPHAQEFTAALARRKEATA